MPVLHVDNADHTIARDYRRGEKCFERVFRKLAKKFEAGIAISFPRNCQEPAFARNPPGETFIRPEPDTANFGFMMRIGCAKHKLVVIRQIDEAGIALGKL